PALIATEGAIVTVGIAYKDVMRIARHKGNHSTIPCGDFLLVKRDVSDFLADFAARCQQKNSGSIYWTSDQQALDDVVHLRGGRPAEALAHHTLHPCAHGQRLALDVLRRPLACAMPVGSQRPGGGSPGLRRHVGEPAGL